MNKSAKRYPDNVEWNDYQAEHAKVEKEEEPFRKQRLCEILNDPSHWSALDLVGLLRAFKQVYKASQVSAFDLGAILNGKQIIEAFLKEIEVRMKVIAGPASYQLTNDEKVIGKWPVGPRIEYELIYNDEYLQNAPDWVTEYGLDERLKCFEIIIMLANGYRLDSIRECELCAKWYFASRHDQRFCKNGCRNAEFKKRPAEKVKKAAYERERYARAKARDAASLKVAQTTI